jgi:hypothetical protein
MAKTDDLPRGKYFVWVKQGGSLKVPFRVRHKDKYKELFPHVDKAIARDSIRLGAVLSILSVLLIFAVWLYFFAKELGLIHAEERLTYFDSATLTAQAYTQVPTQTIPPVPSSTYPPQTLLPSREFIIPSTLSPSPTPLFRGDLPVSRPTQLPSLMAGVIPTRLPSPTSTVVFVPTPTAPFVGDVVSVQLRAFFPDRSDGSDCYRYDFENERCLSAVAAKEFDWRSLYLDYPLAACPKDWLRHALFIHELATVVYCLDTSVSWSCQGDSCLVALLTVDDTLNRFPHAHLYTVTVSEAIVTPAPY